MRLEAVDDLAAARAEWDALAQRSGNVFSTWEWADAWWRHLGDGGRLLAFTCRREDGTAAAILPLCVRRVLGLRMAGWIGAQVGDQLGPVCAPEDRDLAADALREAIALTRGQWDVLLLDGLPAAEGWPSRLSAARIHRMPSPVITFPDGGWDAYLAARSSNFRGQVRRRERRLAREHELGFRLADAPDAVAPALDEVIRLHELRWSDGGSAAFAGARRPFHHDFAARAHARGWLRLWLLELDGQVVAGWYGFRFGGQEWFYQSGRDPGHDSDVVGFVLLAHTVRAAAQDGVAAYRLLAGGEAYKSRFATEQPDCERVVLASGVRGRAYVRALAGRRLAGRVKRRLSSA